MSDVPFRTQWADAFAAIKKDEIETGRLSLATVKAVAQRLARYVNDEGKAWPGRERLAAEMSMSVRTVEQSLGLLVALRWLKVVDEGGGSGHATVYEASIPAGVNGARRSPFAGGKRRTSQQETANVATQNGEPGSPQGLRRKSEGPSAPSSTADADVEKLRNRLRRLIENGSLAGYTRTSVVEMLDEAKFDGDERKRILEAHREAA